MGSCVRVSIEAEKELNLANSSIGCPIITSIELDNAGENDLSALRLVVGSTNGELNEKVVDVGRLAAGEKRSFANFGVRANSRVMQGVSECYEANLYARVFSGDALLGEATHAITVQPVDMWAGFVATPALACFDVPNHPALTPVVARVAELMEARHGSSSLGGYDHPDSRWPHYMVEAAYDALRELKIAYALPPQSFARGQRIRLVGSVLEEKKGTCICLTFAAASLLSSLGLNAIVLMYETHACLGVWVRRGTADEAINRSKESLAKLLEGEDPSVVLIECTMYTHARGGSYEDAKKAAMSRFLEKPGFEYWLDVEAARLSGGMPMPLVFEEPAEGGVEEGFLDEFDDEAAFSDEGRDAMSCPDSGSDVRCGAGDDHEAKVRPRKRKPRVDVVNEELHAHVSELGYNVVTRALMGQRFPRAHLNAPAPSLIDSAGMMAPLAADASQLHALQYVSRGASCVLSGPPGTGKTQVIVNAVAQSVAEGKTVLVAARNAEPLDVIAERMDGACLRPFALKLHGKSVTAANVLEQLEEAASFDEDAARALLAKQGFVPASADADIVGSVELARGLDAYRAALEQKGAVGLTLREEIGKYQEYRHASDMVMLGEAIYGMLRSPATFSEVENVIEEAFDRVNELGGIADCVLSGLAEEVFNAGCACARDSALARAKRLAVLHERVLALDECADAISLSEDASSLFQQMVDLADACKEEWADFRAREMLASCVNACLAAYDEADAFADELAGTWKPSLYALSADDLLYAWDRACAEMPPGRFAAKRRVKKSLEKHAWISVADGDVENAVGAIRFYRENESLARREFFAQKRSVVASLEAEMRACEAISSAGENLYVWKRWLDCRRRAISAGLGSMVAAYEAGEEACAVLASTKKALYQVLCVQHISEDEVARGFSGAAFERSICRFDQAALAARSRSARLLMERCISRARETLADARWADQVAAFKAAVLARGRKGTVADLLLTFPDVVQGLCPCVLVTPETAALYLGWGMKFDMLVVDEASQLNTLHAVGLLERADQVVVVGDSMQLPPMSFFASAPSSEGLPFALKGESLLDECLIAGLPQLMLRWHYRSRHESLIAFSNDRFYHNRLLTFPSSDCGVSSVRLHRVEGCYDGRGVNRSEALAVVAEVRRRYEQSRCAPLSEKGCSLGIIAFNVKQQALLERLLQEEFRTDGEFAAWARSGKERLFVRNLESVQGDERDVILLTIAFGRDSEGKLSLNFGPINKAGGERRLNVALTRARCEMVVFSTIGSADLVLQDSHSEGAHVMRDFLAYAEGVASGYEEQGPSDGRDAIAESLCSALARAGYEVQRNVGASRAKVDIAVVDSKSSGRYLAGILLDGENYRVARSTYDRELGRVKQLRDLGWNICRVWALDYLFDERKCIERVLAYLSELEA